MKIPFTIGHFDGRKNSVNSSRLVNMYAEKSPPGEQSAISLIASPGLKVWVDTESGQPIRGMWRSSTTPELLYVVTDNEIYEYNHAKAQTLIGRTETDTGRVSMSDNGNELMIVDGDYGYTYSWKSEQFGRITDRDFPGGSQVVYQDGYFIISPKDSAQFNVSALYDGRHYDAMDFASAEGNPDNIVAHLSDHRELWLFGAITTEAWYNAGASDYPFYRINGSFIEKGCAAKWSVAKLDNSVFWLSHEKQIVRADGYTPIVLSTQQMDYQVAQYKTVEDAYAFAYVFEGHPFYQITFPTAGTTWILDMSTLLWHQRSSWSDFKPDQEWQHRANAYAFFNNKHLVGDYKNGLIYELSSEYVTDHERPISKEFNIITISADGKKAFHEGLFLRLEYGTGAFGQYITDTEGKYMLNSDYNFMAIKDWETGTFPKVYATLEYSDDGGWNWDGKREIKIGEVGKYIYKHATYKLGEARHRTYRVTCKDPVALNLTSVYFKGDIARD